MRKTTSNVDAAATVQQKVLLTVGFLCGAALLLGLGQLVAHFWIEIALLTPIVVVGAFVVAIIARLLR